MTVQVFKDLSDILTTSDGLAGCLGLTRPRIIQLANESVLDRDKNSKYAIQENIRRYIDYVKNGGKTEESSEEFQADYWQEKAIHEKAKRELTEIKLAKIQGKMHEAKDIEFVLGEMLTTFRTRMQGIPAKVAPRLVGKTDRASIMEELSREIVESLLELKEYDPAMYMEGEDDETEDTETDS